MADGPGGLGPAADGSGDKNPVGDVTMRALEEPDSVGSSLAAQHSRGGRIRRTILTAVAFVLVWSALALPIDLDRTGIVGLARIPIEAVVILALALVLRPRPLKVVSIVIGVLIGVLVALKLTNTGFDISFSRRFDVVRDWYYLRLAADLLTDVAGRVWSDVAAVAAIVLVVILLVLLPWATQRSTAALRRRRRIPGVALGVVVVVWAVFALAGAGPTTAAGVATADTSRLIGSTIAQRLADAHDGPAFARQIAADPYASVPPSQRLAGLQGKDVLLVFIESYGRVALDDPAIAPTVDAALRESAATLATAGFSARSGYLTSPTYGGSSWLAHSTVEAGLWVDSQQRYNQLLAAGRLTLARAFAEGGWRVVFSVPSTTGTWPPGAPFYGFDKLYTAHNVDYHGPTFGYATMPDQYIYHALLTQELTPGHRTPVMAEVDTLSSHYPWTEPPPLLPWNEVGDGSAYNSAAAQPPAAHPDTAKQVYADAVSYALRSLASFAAASKDPNLVILAMGDHQPNATITRPGADHEVPAMLIAHDPALTAKAAAWGWTTWTWRRRGRAGCW
ncbi:MAG: hypothetical protein J0H91_01030 [Rhodospirillales bacterium]|nr:hypothetical protein [Rhodospirillales bacterium]